MQSSKPWNLNYFSEGQTKPFSSIVESNQKAHTSSYINTDFLSRISTPIHQLSDVITTVSITLDSLSYASSTFSNTLSSILAKLTKLINFILISKKSLSLNFTAYRKIGMFISLICILIAPILYKIVQRKAKRRKRANILRIAGIKQ